MKTLLAFWHWVDNEKPAEVLDKQCEPLTDAEQRAVGLACQLVTERLELEDVWDQVDETAMLDVFALNALRDHWPAVRDLSFQFCAGIEVMHEDVPEPEPFTSNMDEFLAVKYANEVKLPDVVMNGSKVFACPGCQRQPCDGTHPKCEVQSFLDGQVTLAKSEAVPPGRVLGREALSGDITIQSGQDYVLTGFMTPEADPSRARVIGIDLGSEPDRVYVAQRRSNHYMGRIEVFKTVTVEEIDRLRGYDRVHTIMLRGRPEDYAASVRYQLAVVLSPYLRQAVVSTPDCNESLKAWGFAGCW